jgi:hypothetical protein
MTPEEIRITVNNWIAARPTPPNPSHFVAVLPDGTVVGPRSTDNEVEQDAFMRSGGEGFAIIRLSEVNQTHQNSVLGSRLSGPDDIAR